MYQETGGGVRVVRTSSDITAMVTRYMEGENIDMFVLSSDQVRAVISAFAEATDCEESQL